uniref:Transcription elongation factor A N-terminal and central domain containing 2 n=1 Tax=Mustela putorius furo TaxID=9669 RepID=M3Y5J7_MUSPF
MDKFVIRTPRIQNSPQKKAPGGKIYKQATIESLKRVVVIEDIKRWKTTLELPDQTRENLVEALQELKKKIPSREVLKSTRIGMFLLNFMKSACILSPSFPPSLKQITSAYCLGGENECNWKKYQIKHRSRISPKEQESRKEYAWKKDTRLLGSSAFELEMDHLLVENIEQEAFHLCSRLINGPYRRTVRALVFTLKHRAEIRAQVKNGSLPVGTFVQNHK